MMTSIACHEVVQGGFTAKDKVSELKDVHIFLNWVLASKTCTHSAKVTIGSVQ